jgi:hypothetical protein
MMKRISRDDTKFDLMRLLDQYARTRGSSIHDQVNQAQFLADLRRDFDANRENPILIHGLRIQAMFAYVAAALGHCTVIKEEDAGEIYAADTSMRPPDFRIVSTEPREFLVEVKNYRPPDPMEPYSMTAAYLDSLRNYALTLKRDLYIAIYWSKATLWSLVSAERFNRDRNHYVLSLPDAMKRNEFALLGDCMLGTLPSLALKLFSNPLKPRRLGPDGKAEFTIARVELYCGDQILTYQKEREIAWFLLNHGDWPQEATPPEIVNGELISLGFRAVPEDRSNPDEDFEIVGFLSQMISRQYNEITAPSGRVDLLSPQQDPETLGVLIPPDFRGEKLRLWRFSLAPNVS